MSKLGTAIHKFFPFNVFDFFNKHYAKLFIDTYLLFDGHKDEYCYGKLYTSSNRLKNDLECISIIAGLSFHTFVRNLVGKQIVICGNKANVNAPNYTINLTNKYNKNPYIQVKNSVSETSYTGYVYCVNVDNHIIYVKRNGVAVWCGNCLSQLSRQRLLSLAVQSQRYCNYAKDRFGRDISFIEPYGLRTDVAKEAWIFSMKEAEAQYFNLIENHKLPAEVARSVLPNSTATIIYAKTNVREWRHIFNLRCDTHAQQDIRWLMTDALTQMFNLYPVFFEDLYIKFVKEAY